MTEAPPATVDHPSAWKGADFAGPDAVAFDLDERHRDALRGVVARARAAGRGLQELTGADIAMPEIESDLLDLRDELVDGRGLLLVRGWPVGEMTDEELGMAYWAVGARFGRGVSQSPMGDRLGYVTDVSRPGARERGYRSARELDLHTDSDDIVGLLCVRQAKSGGESRLASSAAVYNAIAAERPDLLEPLFEGYVYHWFGEQPPGQGTVTSYPVPVFGHAGGRLSCIFLREFIRMAAEETGVAPTDRQAEALAFFVEVADREDMVFRFRLEPGWASSSTTTRRSIPAPASRTGRSRRRNASCSVSGSGPGRRVRSSRTSAATTATTACSSTAAPTPATTPTAGRRNGAEFRILRIAVVRDGRRETVRCGRGRHRAALPPRRKTRSVAG